LLVLAQNAAFRQNKNDDMLT